MEKLIRCFSKKYFANLEKFRKFVFLLKQHQWKARIIGIAAVLKTAGLTPMGVRIPRFPLNYKKLFLKFKDSFFVVKHRNYLISK